MRVTIRVCSVREWLNEMRWMVFRPPLCRYRLNRARMVRWMTLPSRRRIRNSNPGDLKPSSLFFSITPSHNIKSLRVSRGDTFSFFKIWMPERAHGFGGLPSKIVLVNFSPFGGLFKVFSENKEVAPPPPWIRHLPGAGFTNFTWRLKSVLSSLIGWDVITC